MTVTARQLSFTGGEWSSSLYQRTDLAKYPTAVRKMRNFFVHPHGGASNRGGTKFVASTKYHNYKSRMVPFQFSVTQSYILEFGYSYMRVVKDGGQVVNTGVTITGATKANPVRISCNIATLSNNDYVYITGVVGMTQLNGKTYKLSGVSSGGANLLDEDGNNVNGTAYSTYTSGGTLYEIYEIATPYAEADLATLKFTQSADTMYITHKNYAPRKLTRTDHNAWTLTTVIFGASLAKPLNLSSTPGTGDVLFKVTAVNSEGEESLPSGHTPSTDGAALTWDTGNGAGVDAYYNVYKDSTKSGLFGWRAMSTNKSYTEPSVGGTEDVTKTPPIANAPFNATNKYPAVCAFFEQRMLYARSNNYPQTIWGSQILLFDNFNKTTPIKSTDSFEFTIYSNQVNEIRWIVPLDDILIGTAGGEWRMSAGTNADTVGPNNVLMRRQSEWGVSELQPLVIGKAVLFTQASGDVVRDLSYSFEVDGYAGNDLTIFANHLLKNYQVKEWAYQQRPDSIVWCVRNDGALLGLTYYKEHEIFSWHRHDTDGDFESIACIRDGSSYDVYAVVKRTINNLTRRYVEKLEDRLPMNSSYEYDVADSYFVDCGATYDSTPATTISGLHHLEGKTVVALADGNVVSNLTVTNGVVTLPAAASKVHIGLPYTCEIETLDFVASTQDGSIQDKLRDVKTVVISLENTRALWFGPNVDRLNEVPFRTTEDYGDPTALFTGDKEISLEAGNEREARCYLKVTEPLPITVLAIQPRVEYGSN